MDSDSFSGGEEKKAKIVMMKYGDKKYFGFIDADDKCFGYFGTAYQPRNSGRLILQSG